LRRRPARAKPCACQAACIRVVARIRVVWLAGSVVLPRLELARSVVLIVGSLVLLGSPVVQFVSSRRAPPFTPVGARPRRRMTVSQPS
jgi:hypothetical protein